MKKQETPFDSPWTARERFLMFLWDCTWVLVCMWTPKPCNRWRLCWLKLFGAKIHGLPFVHQRALIQVPWNLTLYDRACLGDRANAYSLGRIEIGKRVTVAQEAYLCTGSHEFADPALPLIARPIVIKDEAFIGARAFILPGVTIGRRAIVGACSVVTKNVDDGECVAGNPARPLGKG